MPERLTARVLPRSVDAASVFLALESSAADVFWLDAGADARDGWSFVGRGTPGEVPADLLLGGEGGDDGLPPFGGGWIGWCEYETGARRAGAPAADGSGDSWMRATHIAAFDHATGRVWVLSAAEELDAWSAFVTAPPPAIRRPGAESALTAIARHSPEQYAELIESCRDLIRAGIAYQLCLTTRFTVPGTHDAVSAYLRLRSATPAHHGGFVRIGERTLLSASPEQFLHVAGGVVRTKPIKGTRPRGADEETDAALAAELRGDAKERAENVMIVDLMRNDLSRVCEPGSIRVDGLWVVESYPAVHQLVSTVSGTLVADTTLDHLLEAAFPAGSMTGAPKLSAMTRLHGLEGGPRGVYAGCFGFVGVDGAVDLAMVIRSIVIEPDAAWVGAGGGITWGSVSASEVAEVATKARAPLAALGAGMPALWASDILN